MAEAVMRRLSAFRGGDLVASGDEAGVAAALRTLLAEGPEGPIVVLDDATGRVVDLDPRQGIAATAEPEPLARRVGRPRLGVVAREVTLLPRHWDWLASQPGGASVALRRLVEAARREAEPHDRLRQRREAAYRAMATLAGDAAGFEEAARALFAGDLAMLDALSRAWPDDIGAYVRRLAADGLEPSGG